MSILDDLGIDPEDFTWQKVALCQNVDTELFFDQYESSTEVAKQVDQMCFVCPVMKECLMQGMQENEHGVWGGIYFNGSGKPDKNRNKHKTDADWSIVRAKMS